MAPVALPLGCVSGPEILVILGLMAAGSVGMLFVFYWPYRVAMNALAKGPLMGKPLAYFGAAFFGAIVWVGGLWGGLALAFDIKEKWGVALFLVLGLAGTVGWLVLLVQWLAGRRRTTSSEPSSTSSPPPPTPKLQVWAQDLVVAMLCYGTGLTLISAYYGLDRSQMAAFLAWAVYLFFAGSIGLIAAADVCRRSAAGQEPAPRAAVFALIFALFPATLPVALLAWFRWRRGLSRAAA